ncbi:MAG: IS701 family transposase, partial [Methanosarcinales archaeon]|nr:IS701 family transposase [Methanosarcinales archaeon]
MQVGDLKASTNKLKQFHNKYVLCFITKTRSLEKQSLQYLQGIFLEKGRGNMVNYARNVPDTNNQALQNFISDSPWNERPVINQIQKDVTELIGDKNNGSIHIDESGFKKSGKNSVGVKRQYCGRLWKVENCQVGVYLGYANGNHRTLIDEQLYLPEDWVNDPVRRQQCGVPDDVTFKTKAELGLEMMLNAKEGGMPFAWVGMDCFYGEQPWLRSAIDSNRMIYIADVPCDTQVWLNLPKTEIPEKKGTRGRNPTIEKLALGEPKPVQVQKLAKHPDVKYSRVFLRDTERKEFWSRLACLRVYPVEDKLPGKEIWLIIRKDENDNKTKYQFSNAPVDTSIERLGQMSCSRYWMERALQDAKGTAKMADYQVRGWTGWHHHMVMTVLAMLFILGLQVEFGQKAPMTSVQDVKEILEVIMPRKEITEAEILAIILQKHRA